MPVKLASPKMTSFVESGTPFVQFEAIDQKVLVVPFQLVVCAVLCCKVTSNINITQMALVNFIIGIGINNILNIMDQQL